MFSVFCVTVKRPVLYIKSQFNSLNFVTNSTFRKDSATLYVAESCGHLFDNIGGIVIIFVEKKCNNCSNKLCRTYAAEADKERRE